MKIGTA